MDTILELDANLELVLSKKVVGLLNGKGGKYQLALDFTGPYIQEKDLLSIKNELTSMLNQSISPSILRLISYEIHSEDNELIISLNVEEGIKKPYYLSAYGCNPRGVFLSENNTLINLNNEQINDLKTDHHALNLINKKAINQDLTFSQLKLYYQQSMVNLSDGMLRNLGVKINSEYNYLGYLLSDQCELNIEVIKYQGFDRLIKEEQLTFSSQSLIKSCYDVILFLDNEYSKMQPKYDNQTSMALKEVVLNAFIHCDYLDDFKLKFEVFANRIIISNSGGLIKDLSQKDFFEGVSICRNPQLMRVFKDLRLAYQMGNGMSIITEALEKSNFKFKEKVLEIAFLFNIKEVKDTIKDTIKDTLSKNQQLIVKMIETNSYVTVSEMSEALKINERNIKKNLAILKERGVLIRIGAKKNGKWIIIG